MAHYRQVMAGLSCDDTTENVNAVRAFVTFASVEEFLCSERVGDTG